jgi:hypothetical protein
LNRLIKKEGDGLRNVEEEGAEEDESKSQPGDSHMGKKNLDPDHVGGDFHQIFPDADGDVNM